MKKTKLVHKDRNWALVFISLILILLGLVLTIVSIAYMNVFGWSSILIGITGGATVGASVMAIIQNDPSWILLDLIFPW